MVDPLRAMAALVNPNNWIQLGTQLLRATPILIPIYGVLLGTLQAIPIRNSNVDLERLAFLQQQLAFLLTIEIHLVWSLARGRRRA